MVREGVGPLVGFEYYIEAVNIMKAIVFVNIAVILI